MNERIKELIFETDEWLESNAQSDRWEREIKFANLIVAECVGIVAKRKNQAIDDDCNVDEAMTMAEMDLLEHFGVEE